MRTPLSLGASLLVLTCVGCAAPRPAPTPRVPAAAVCAPQPARVVRRTPPAAGPGFTQADLPLEQVLAEAGRRGRPALVYFCADWCGWCDRMNRQTLARPEVAARLGDFVAVRYDPDTERGRRLSQQFGARGFPTMVLLDAQGNELDRIVGYREPTAFLAGLSGY